MLWDTETMRTLRGRERVREGRTGLGLSVKRLAFMSQPPALAACVDKGKSLSLSEPLSSLASRKA